jgi:hypothetical protein
VQGETTAAAMLATRMVGHLERIPETFQSLSPVMRAMLPW